MAVWEVAESFAALQRVAEPQLAFAVHLEDRSVYAVAVVVAQPSLDLAVLQVVFGPELEVEPLVVVALA